MARIAVLDDEELRNIAQKFLTALRGHEVKTYQSVPEFEGREDGFEPELIISDENMPPENGSRWLQRKREEGAEIPVCIASTLFGKPEELALLRVFAGDFIYKDAADFGKRAVEYVRRKLERPDSLFFYHSDGRIEEIRKCAQKGTEGCGPCRGYSNENCRTYLIL